MNQLAGLTRIAGIHDEAFTWSIICVNYGRLTKTKLIFVICHIQNSKEVTFRISHIQVNHTRSKILNGKTKCNVKANINAFYDHFKRVNFNNADSRLDLLSAMLDNVDNVLNISASSVQMKLKNNKAYGFDNI